MRWWENILLDILLECEFSRFNRFNTLLNVEEFSQQRLKRKLGKIFTIFNPSTLFIYVLKLVLCNANGVLVDINI